MDRCRFSWQWIDQSDSLNARMQKIIVLSLAVAVAILSSSCVGDVVTAHENFKDQLNRKIGKSIDNLPQFWARERDLIDEKILPNGNMEYRYQGLRSCQYTFEVEPKARTIVSAHFEGKESDCVINP